MLNLFKSIAQLAFSEILSKVGFLNDWKFDHIFFEFYDSEYKFEAFLDDFELRSSLSSMSECFDKGAGDGVGFNEMCKLIVSLINDERAIDLECQQAQTVLGSTDGLLEQR